MAFVTPDKQSSRHRSCRARREVRRPSKARWARRPPRSSWRMRRSVAPAQIQATRFLGIRIRKEADLREQALRRDLEGPAE